jgi:hypothetical protein
VAKVLELKVAHLASLTAFSNAWRRVALGIRLPFRINARLSVLGTRRYSARKTSSTSARAGEMPTRCRAPVLPVPPLIVTRLSPIASQGEPQQRPAVDGGLVRGDQEVPRSHGGARRR